MIFTATPGIGVFELGPRVDRMNLNGVDTRVKLETVRMVHSPRICPDSITYISTIGMLGAGQGAYASFMMNYSWGGLLASAAPVYYTPVSHKITVNAVTLEHDVNVKFGVDSLIVNLPFTVIAPSPGGTVQLQITMQAGSDGAMYTCPSSEEVTVTYKTFIPDPEQVVVRVGHVYEVSECFLGVCSINWPFGLGASFWIIVIASVFGAQALCGIVVLSILVSKPGVADAAVKASMGVPPDLALKMR